MVSVRKGVMFFFLIVLILVLQPCDLAFALSTNSSFSVSVETQSASLQAIERLFTQPLQTRWFASKFLQQVPAQRLKAIISSIQQQLGAFKAVQAIGQDEFRLTFERGNVLATLGLDAEGRIGTLLLRPEATAVSPEEAVDAIQTFSGETSLLILRNGTPLATHNSDRPLAVGSAFKLAVLSALLEQIEQDVHQWDAVVSLEPDWKSLPSGILQDWPDGAAVTLATLATLMISLSDNTATDALIAVVGREAIEAIAPRNQPWLTTRQFFALKNPQNQSLLEQFRAGTPDQRRALLPKIAVAELPSASLFSGKPIALDVEWLFTTQELCHLIEKVKDLPLMSVNPGVAMPQNWQQIAFKGGSEPGVLNLTTWLQSDNGTTYCVSATWNNPSEALDEAQLSNFYRQILSGLRIGS